MDDIALIDEFTGRCRVTNTGGVTFTITGIGGSTTYSAFPAPPHTLAPGASFTFTQVTDTGFADIRGIYFHIITTEGDSADYLWPVS